MFIPLVLAFGGVACILLLVAEYRQQTGRIRCWKMAAASAYIALAVASGGFHSVYGRVLIGALAFSWVGDLLLLSDKRPAYFLAGLTSFLLAHFAFLLAMLSTGSERDLLVWSASGVALALIPVVIWLWPHLPRRMRMPVVAYMAVLGGMVAVAIAVSMQLGHPVFAVAAVLFAVSDLAVARQQFVGSGFANKAWGLPLYFLAQYLFALTPGFFVA